MSTAAQVHGMDGSLVACDWPPITLDELTTLFARLPGCGQPRRILSVSPRPFSAACVVETNASHIFVKRHPRSVRSVDGLEQEHRFMAHLRAHGAPVPHVYSSEEGHTAHAQGEWTCEVHEVPQGVDAYQQAISWTPFHTAAHAHSAGFMLARLHLAAEGYSAPARSMQPLVASFSIFASEDPAHALEHYLAARPALTRHANARRCALEALDLLAPFAAELQPLLPALRPLWTHNDLHASNMLWSSAAFDAQAVAAIDFGLADRTNAVHDLAHAIERNIVEWLTLVNDPVHPEAVAIHFDHLEALLTGYESVRPLRREEAAALAPMLALCHAEFALTEADYFLGPLHNEERAPSAYDAYLVGHAQWFRGAGSRLIEDLRTWAAKRTFAEAMQ
ncbi:phosphotransferase enzyme family protein [Telmatobacter bradus]|uniref:phosphotransferase enzyme family protein n=1 Tax=Telmatobacter bradus TaxID=474953 RepID=UPI003B42FEDF